jgi:hypothetical protein
MAGFSLATVRAAIGNQLRENLAEEVNVDVDGAGMSAPVVRLQMDRVPDYFGTYGPDGVAFCRFRVVLDPGGVDQSAVIRLDRMLDVGQGNGSSVIDALMVDQSFGGAVSGFTYEPGEYDADNVVAELFIEFIAMKQGANV